MDDAEPSSFFPASNQHQ